LFFAAFTIFDSDVPTHEIVLYVFDKDEFGSDDEVG
jgi:hypothetical protein